MISATHVIMTIHSVLVLLPILGFLVLPCESTHLGDGLRIVGNITVEKPEDCITSLCPDASCTHALLNEDKHCFLISCTQDVRNSSCESITNIKELFAEQESVHVDKNKSDGSPYQSSGNISSQTAPDGSSANVKQQLPPTANLSTSSPSTSTSAVKNHSASTVTTKLPSPPSKQAPTPDAPGAVPTTITTAPATTSTTTTTTTTMPATAKPSASSTNTTATTNATTTLTTTTTTKPSTTSTSTAVEQTAFPPQPFSHAPSGNKTSASITPLVPTTPPSTPSSTQPSPAPTSTKQSPTMPKASTSSLVVAPTLPKDISGEQGRTDQAKAEVAGDPLTIHLLNTSSLLAVLIFGLLFFVVTVALFLKQAYESYKRKDYTQVDYLINGMYSDSGV